MDDKGFLFEWWEESDNINAMEEIWNAEARKMWPDNEDRLNAMKGIAKEIDSAMQSRLDNMYHSRII